MRGPMGAKNDKVKKYDSITSNRCALQEVIERRKCEGINNNHSNIYNVRKPVYTRSNSVKAMVDSYRVHKSFEKLESKPHSLNDNYLSRMQGYNKAIVENKARKLASSVV